MQSLDDLAERFGTDKGTRQVPSGLVPKGYTSFYERILRRDLPDPWRSAKMVEIGIGAHAGSALLWRTALPGWQIVMVDYDRRKLRRMEQALEVTRLASPNVHGVLADMSDPVDAERVGVFVDGKRSPLWLVIDDGGHTHEQHVLGFEALWSSLHVGGWYVFEDLHAADCSRTLPWLEAQIQEGDLEVLEVWSQAIPGRDVPSLAAVRKA